MWCQVVKMIGGLQPQSQIVRQQQHHLCKRHSQQQQQQQMQQRSLCSLKRV
jgi:hypothetical protein